MSADRLTSPAPPGKVASSGQNEGHDRCASDDDVVVRIRPFPRTWNPAETVIGSSGLRYVLVSLRPRSSRRSPSPPGSSQGAARQSEDIDGDRLMARSAAVQVGAVVTATRQGSRLRQKDATSAPPRDGRGDVRIGGTARRRRRIHHAPGPRTGCHTDDLRQHREAVSGVLSGSRVFLLRRATVETS